MSTNEEYYIPHKAVWPVVGTVGLMTLLAGFANYLNGNAIGPNMMILGLVSSLSCSQGGLHYRLMKVNLACITKVWASLTVWA